MRDKLMLLVVLVGLIFGLSASALEYSPDCAEFSNKTTDWNRTLSVDKFDPSLGVLKGVKVSADACASQLFMLDSEDSEPQCWTVVTNAWLSAAMPDGKDFVLSFRRKPISFVFRRIWMRNPTLKEMIPSASSSKNALKMKEPIMIWRIGSAQARWNSE